jgi:hypothetical protein
MTSRAGRARASGIVCHRPSQPPRITPAELQGKGSDVQTSRAIRARDFRRLAVRSVWDRVALRTSRESADSSGTFAIRLRFRSGPRAIDADELRGASAAPDSTGSLGSNADDGSVRETRILLPFEIHPCSRETAASASEVVPTTAIANPIAGGSSGRVG